MLWNAISSPYHGPHVYVICTIDVVYIGETQKHPVIRWGQHLEDGGTFRVRLAEKGNPDFAYLDDLLMFAKRCDWIMTRFTEAQWKTVTQALEHTLHVKFAEDPRILGDHLRLISDTEKTAPRGFKYWDIVNGCAHDIVDELRRAFNERPGLIRASDKRAKP